MSERFSVTVGRLAGLASRSLAWTPETFWNATPSELALALGSEENAAALPPTRGEIAAMIERDNNE